eukprot:3639096-Pyramimonas_sp.AAC.1
MCAPRREGRSRGGFFVFRWLGPGDRQRHAAEPGPPRRGRGGHRSTGHAAEPGPPRRGRGGHRRHISVQDMLQNQDRLAHGGVAIAGTVHAQYSTGMVQYSVQDRTRTASPWAGGHR